MRMFQNGETPPSYRKRVKKLTANAATFEATRQVLLDDRFATAHFLKPILDGVESAFFADGDAEYNQRLWAHENGLAQTFNLDQILLAQVEDHRTEVFYNLDPMRFVDDFICDPIQALRPRSPSGNYA